MLFEQQVYRHACQIKRLFINVTNSATAHHVPARGPDDFLDSQRDVGVGPAGRSEIVLQDRLRTAFLGEGGRQAADVLDKLNVTRFVPVSDRDYQIIRDLQ